ncbi:MAG: UDP-N-acetylenolpyruvoylglucosamine reductase [Alphaproteobacteria bacterium 16-39-46]|nr:MAG: UDP-N-acetylenolpyruvoylglucosamine reductase [Alphaproteobacteria bacterium 16-39-46]OZA43956.1 MAG: UDP-N-acetylenolpyruvoylglucosamine reductase [Alphaproteobacteria bacterium 17-39-52]HQS83466.1 UDP-N-acetylmuramate dehydrogenase [Alphaproteobacteria bacterium]HQS93260.1 UDP-N-acetylmuramate dehydrogenase [Alphaproteobacteria bacterium]
MYQGSKNSSLVLKELPKVRGRYLEDAPLAKYTWFRVGGNAEILFKPEDIKDLQDFLKHKNPEVPVTLLGMGSNVLIRSSGISGVVIKLGKGFSKIILKDETNLEVEAAVLDRNIALTAAEYGLSGLEFLSGIPGTLGGALRMNAGAYGSEIKDILEKAFVLDPLGNLHALSVDDLKMTYRSCGLPEGWIFVGALLRGVKGDPTLIKKAILEIMTRREETQPIRTQTGGSTFANPEGQRAWELIDAAGCRGLKRGGAQVSEKHCNFLINTGEATPEDLENLGLEVQDRVLKSSGVLLKWEIRCLGKSLKF